MISTASAMDAIGWQEVPDAPDRQAVQRSGALVCFARSEAQDLMKALWGVEPQGVDFDAYRALSTIRGDA